MHRRHKSQEDLPQSRKRHNALIAGRRAPREHLQRAADLPARPSPMSLLAAAGAELFADLTMYNLRRALRLGAG
jgi:hypothetical protein